jgi:peptide/nickel transport system substrate-binding protein
MAIGFGKSYRGIMAAAAFAAVAGFATTSDAQQPKSGGSLSISIESDLPTLDPTGFASFNDREAGIILYDTLLDIDSKGKIIPHLAEKLEAAPDATWFKITLRSGVKFHDGTPLDAAAVVAHFKRMMDPKNHCRCIADLTPIDTVEATGPLEVTFKMKTPSAPFPAALADVAGMIESPTAVAKYNNDLSTHPVGTGPFIFKEWQRGAQIVFERNPNYWGKAPYLDQVVLRPMPDEQARYASLQAGNLDVIMNAAARDVIDAKQNKKFTVIDPGSLATVFIQINTSMPDVSDVRVRQAMAYALDRVTLNKVINKGLYPIANTVFGSGLSPHELVDGYPNYDPAKAKKLLADYGKPVKVKLAVNAAPLAVLSGQAIQQMWKKVGIETQIDQYEQVQLIRAAAARDYQVMLYRWAGGADPDKNVYQFFHSKGVVNRTAYNNPEMDKLLDDARSTTNTEARLELYHKINNILARDLPYILLNYFTNYALAAPSVHGIVGVPDGLIRLPAVWKDQ